MSPKNNNIIIKIQKLLSLANSSNENEAKAAMNMANILLLKHNISLQQINDRKPAYKSKDVASDLLTLKQYQKLIISLLKDYFFVEAIIVKEIHDYGARAQYKKTIQLIGTAENCEIASYIFDYLDKAYPQLWQSYRKKNIKNNPNSTTRSFQISYYHGLTKGIKSMLEATRWKVQEETGLILKTDANLTKFVEQKTNGKYGASARATINDKAYNDGVNDGSNITLRKPIKAEGRNSEVKGFLG
jgi:hypothetical protein